LVDISFFAGSNGLLVRIRPEMARLQRPGATARKPKARPSMARLFSRRVAKTSRFTQFMPATGCSIAFFPFFKFTPPVSGAPAASSGFAHPCRECLEKAIWRGGLWQNGVTLGALLTPEMAKRTYLRGDSRIEAFCRPGNFAGWSVRFYFGHILIILPVTLFYSYKSAKYKRIWLLMLK
jgi:hypothetical protein